MPLETEHGRLIAAAAKSVLTPLGFRRRGRSRVYIADRRFWLNIVEFQPSGFSKGSYLNVCAHWLWNPESDRSFDYGQRIDKFIEFDNTEQFEPAVMNLAAVAAGAARELWNHFSSIEKTARVLVMKEDKQIATGHGGSWLAYHAAIAAGLAGDVDTSLRMFAQATATSRDAEWVQRLRASSAELAALIGAQPSTFQKTMLAVIQQARLRLALPPDPECLLPSSPNVLG